jgi:hypothetical protein
MCLAIRSRLGMLPALSLRTESCLSCHARNTVHEPRFEDDPDYFQACLGRAPPGASVTSRHHRIAGEVAHFARQGGYSVVREPLFDSVVVMATAVDPVTGIEFDQEQVAHDTERGDLLLIRGDQRLLIDVTIVRPTAPTHMRNLRLKVTTRGLTCAAAAERAKHAKYDALCKERGWQMVPFAIESHGAIGDSARQLLQKLASHVDDMSGHSAPVSQRRHRDRRSSAPACESAVVRSADESGTRPACIRITPTHGSSHRWGALDESESQRRLPWRPRPGCTPGRSGVKRHAQAMLVASIALHLVCARSSLLHIHSRFTGDSSPVTC